MGSSTDVAVSKLKSQLADAEELILPLLHKLMENEDKEYIYCQIKQKGNHYTTNRKSQKK